MTDYMRSVGPQMLTLCQFSENTFVPPRKTDRDMLNGGVKVET